MDFQASVQGADGLLEWRTLQEHNTGRFILEHSMDKLAYEALGELPAAGHSDQVLDYRFVHRQPADGVHYYRLKVVDINGEFDYSPVRVLHFGVKKEALYAVYPNPSDGVFNFEFRLSEKADIQLRVFGMDGKLLRDVNIQRGVSGHYVQSVDLTELPAGVYLYRLSVNGKSHTGKLTIK